MKLRFRLAFYLFGLFLGIFAVVQFLGAKAEAKGVMFCYLPNCRVLKDLRSKSLNYSPEAKATLEENWVNLGDIKKTLEFGDVDFSKSNKAYKKGKIYIIEGQNSNNEEITVTMINFTDKVLLEKIEKK